MYKMCPMGLLVLIACILIDLSTASLADRATVLPEIPPMVIRLSGFDFKEFDNAVSCPDLYRRIRFVDDSSTSFSRESPGGIDAAIWHLPTWYQRKLIETRPAHQRWVLVSQESPVNIPSHSEFYRSKMVNQFTSLATYQLSSDVRWVYGNCSRSRLMSPGRREGALEGVLEGDREDGNYARGKLHLVMWAVSNCLSFSGRESIARGLFKALGSHRMHIYGGCGWPEVEAKSCPRGDSCERKLYTDYKFTLAFENSLCSDYLTEKTFTGMLLRHAQVPVVLSRTFLRDRLPPGSFVDVRDYPSVEALAAHLIYLDSNDTAYNEYFKWRRRGWTCHGMAGTCNVLRLLLHQRDERLPITAVNLMTEFSPKSACVDYATYRREYALSPAAPMLVRKTSSSSAVHYPLAGGKNSRKSNRSRPIESGHRVQGYNVDEGPFNNIKNEADGSVADSMNQDYNSISRTAYVAVFLAGIAFAGYVANKMHVFKRNNRSRIITSSTGRMF